MKVLVTGGCGFIGSHLVDRLVDDGHAVRVFDFLEPQVHGKKKPGFLNAEVEYVFQDVRDRAALKKALRGIDIVFHMAAQVGVGQSMYEIEKYVSHNSGGTAMLLDLLVNTKNKVNKLLVASSMTIYGEGAYRCPRCGIVFPQLRMETQLKKRDWEMKCPHCKTETNPCPTGEEKPLFPSSVYAGTKRSQEELCLSVGSGYNIPTVALRYFNAYGPRQSLNNPYTGVAAIFLSRVKNGNPPLIFEDGLQSRDFIHVSDIVEANIRAMKNPAADYEIFNVGSGIPRSVLDVARTVITACGKRIKPLLLKQFRRRDIRHCYADTSKITRVLGFTPRVTFEEGMNELIAWSGNQPCRDLTRKAQAELRKRGLTS